MTKSSSSLFINALKLNVRLGWSNKERSKKQIVWLDVAITFPKVPKACVTDHLDDTFCYSMLIEKIKKSISAKEFRLIEHLTADIHKVIKSLLPKKTGLDVCITKYPNIKDLSGGVSFHYGDHQ